MRELAPRQHVALVTIERFIAEHGYPPTTRELGQAMGTKPQAAWYNLDALARKGYIAVDAGIRRGIRVLRPSGEVPTIATPSAPKTPGYLLRPCRCLVCNAITFASKCPMCGRALLEVAA